MTNKQRALCRKIVTHYGEKAQRRILIEECAELVQAVTKLERAETAGKFGMEERSHLCEELADVMIMVEQIASCYSWNLISAYIDKKLERQMKRIEEEKE